VVNLLSSDVDISWVSKVCTRDIEIGPGPQIMTRRNGSHDITLLPPLRDRW
jgi:hypothetical protein